MRNRLLLLSSCLFSLLGCGEPRAEVVDADVIDAAPIDAAVVDASVSDTGVDAAVPAVTPRELGARRAESICAQLFDCCDGEQLETLLHRPVADEAECATLLSGSYATWVAQVEAASERGTLDYDPERASACLASIAALECETLDIRVPPDACRRVALGRVQDGSPCVMEDECADASSCRDGVCVGPVPAGADCTAAPCELGFYCGGMSSGIGGEPRCYERVPNGGACVIDSQCASQYCMDDSVCAQSRACEPR